MENTLSATDKFDQNVWPDGMVYEMMFGNVEIESVPRDASNELNSFHFRAILFGRR